MSEDRADSLLTGTPTVTSSRLCKASIHTVKLQHAFHSDDCESPPGTFVLARPRQLFHSCFTTGGCSSVSHQATMCDVKQYTALARHHPFWVLPALPWILLWCRTALLWRWRVHQLQHEVMTISRACHQCSSWFAVVREFRTPPSLHCRHLSQDTA